VTIGAPAAPPATAASPPSVARPEGGRVTDLVALTKPRLNALAVFAVGAGWWAAGGRLDSAEFVLTLAGSGMVAAASSVLNQWIERRRDARMDRTSSRPLPSGRVDPRDALLLGVALAAAGIATLLLGANVAAAGAGAACLLSYLLLYTPLKTRTSLNTLVGAVPGALPPVIGVLAVMGRMTPAAWFLFALLAAWQLPHFLAIAWLHREDYRRGGFAMLPVVEGGEGSTARQAVVQSLLVLVVSLAALPLGLAGKTYFWVALGAGVLFVAAAVSFAVSRTDAAARRLLRASIVHLPAVLVAFAADAAAR